MSKPALSQQAKFDGLRAKHLKSREAYGAVERAVSSKYGSTAWASRSEKSKLERLKGAVSRTGDALFEYVQSISPRSWSSGVPFWWVCEKLAYADAVRSLTEPLSVVPPLAYGSTVPIS